MKKLLVSVLVLGLGISGAMAQAASDFTAVDIDASGDVSLIEAQAVWPDLTEEAFAAAERRRHRSGRVRGLSGCQSAGLRAAAFVRAGKPPVVGGYSPLPSSRRA